MENAQTSSNNSLPKKDFWLGLLVGLLIGLLFMPVLKTAKPDLYLKFKLAIIPFFLIGTPLGLIVSHFIGKKISVVWQLAKFIVTGVLNVLVDLGVLSILIFLFRNYLNINSSDVILSTLGITLTVYSVYKAISFIVANINSYFWNKFWTFEKKEGKQTEFIQFFIVSVIGFVVNVVIASLVFNGFSSIEKITTDQWAIIGAMAGSIAGLAWNFLGYKFLVFKK